MTAVVPVHPHHKYTLGFVVEGRVIVFDNGQARPATEQEKTMWRFLVSLVGATELELDLLAEDKVDG